MDPGSASYVFAIASRECSVMVFNEMDKIFEPQGKKVDAAFAVPMPQIDLPVFEMEEQEEIERKEIAMLREPDRIKEIVSTQKQYRKPVWDKKVNCYFCFACIHYCPVKAIQIKGSKSKERGRYHHADVPAAEIMKEKESRMN